MGYTLLVRARASAPYSIASLQAARRTISEMQELGGLSSPNVITYNALLQGCVSASQFSLGIEVLTEMLEHEIAPTRKTFSILTADPLPTRKGKRSSATLAVAAPSRATLKARLFFFLDVVGVFELYRRQLNGEAYISILAMCARLDEYDAARCMCRKRQQKLF